MEGDWSSREGRLGPAQIQDFCVPERDTPSVHLSQVSLDGGYGGSEACSSEIFHHCQQPSYAHSEGYYSYVSSTDSITPFIDRLKRELEFTEIHENNHCSGSNHGASKWEESETDGFREKNTAKESESVWQDGGSTRDRTSYRAAGGSTRLSSPPLPATDPKLSYLSRVPLFHNTSYESISIDQGSRLSTAPLAGASSQPTPANRLQPESSCLTSNHKSSRVQPSHNACYRNTDGVHITRSHGSAHHLDRENSDTRPTKLINGNSCDVSDPSRGLSTNRDPSDSVRLTRIQPSSHSPRCHSNQGSNTDPSIGFPSKTSSANETCRPARNDPLNSSFRSHISNADSSLNSISRSNSSESSLSSRIYPNQTQSNESANIARSSRIPPPQRHLSQSVLYLSADHRKLFPISTYQPEPPRVVGAVSVSERVVELESRFGGLKAIQKKALLSFYQRHQAAVPAPPPPPRRASSASDYLQLKGGLDAISTSSSSSQSSKEPTTPTSVNSGSLTKDNKQHHRSCGSLSGISGPVIVGRSISVDDWVPARPPKSAHLRPRPPSPEPPPPPSSPPQQYSDEPLPPPPGPDELPLHTPSLPSRHPSPGPQVPTSKTYPRISDTRPSTDHQCRPLKTLTIESQFSSSAVSHTLDTRPQKLSELSANERNISSGMKPQYNGSINNHNKIITSIPDHQKQVEREHKDARLSEPRSPTHINNSATIVNHPKNVDLDYKDIHLNDHRSTTHIKSTAATMDHHKKIDTDHKDIHLNDQRSTTHIKSAAAIMDHPKKIDTEQKDIRHNEQRSTSHMKSPATVMNHPKKIDTDHEDIHLNDQRTTTHIKSTATILDYTNKIDIDHKDINLTEQRSPTHIKNTSTNLDHPKKLDTDHKDVRLAEHRSNTHIKSTPSILDQPNKIDNDHKDIRLIEQRSSAHVFNSDQRKCSSIEVLPSYHRIFPSSARSTPVSSDYHVPCRLFNMNLSETEQVQELNQSVNSVKSKSHYAVSRTTASGLALIEDRSAVESQLISEISITNQVKDVALIQALPQRINLTRTRSRDTLPQHKSDQDKVKRSNEESQGKESKQILRKTSFRCSEKIQQSIDSLHNSLRGSHKDPDSPPTLIKQLMEEDSRAQLRLSTSSLTQLDCITLTDNLSASRTSLCDIDVEKDDGIKSRSENSLASSNLDSLSVGTLQQKKEELVTRLSRKLSVLRAEAAAVAEETTANEELGEAVVDRVSTAWGPREASRLRSHVADLGRLTALLLTLTTRLARADNALLALSSCHPDKSALETKRDRLASQLEEARRLKEKVDKRNETVTGKLKERLTSDEYSDFMHFVSLKSKLLLDSREIADKIKLGEEQLQALQMTLSAVT